MAINIPTNVGYGFKGGPLLNQAPVPFTSKRSPTTADKAQIGQIWINEPGNLCFILASIIDNISTWIPFGTTAGDVKTLTGNTGGAVSADASNNINVEGDGIGIVISGNPASHTLTASLIGGGTAVQTFDGDTGSATPTASGVITFEAAITMGRTVTFAASGHLLELNASDVHNNTAIGNEAGNTGTGSNNTSLGFSALGGTGTGSNNTALGYEAGLNYNSTESSNILIGSSVGGTSLESNVLRIGNGTGSGTGQLAKAFISGINGVDVASTANVVTSFGDQLGTAVITAGTGITITPTANVITIATSGTSLLNYTSVTTSPYVVAATDEYLGVTTSSIAITIELPNAPATGRVFIIKDTSGNSSTHNITVTTVGGVVNIDGATTFVMNTNFESINVLFDGTAYEVF